MGSKLTSSEGRLRKGEARIWIQTRKAWKAWDFYGIFCVRFSVLAASGDEGVDDLPSAEVFICPTESELCTDQVLIEVRIFNEDQMVCNVEGASFYELRIAGNCRKGRSGFWCFWCVFSGLALATMHAGVPLKNSRAIWQDPGPCSGSSLLPGQMIYPFTSHAFTICPKKILNCRKQRKPGGLVGK